LSSRSAYPVFSVPSLEAFLARLTPGIEAVDHLWLTETVGLSEKDARQLSEGLCILGFTEPTGHLTAEGKLLAAPDARGAVFGRVCAKVYANMIDSLLQEEEFNTDHVHQFLIKCGITHMRERQKTTLVFRFLVFNSDREDLIKRYSSKKCFA